MTDDDYTLITTVLFVFLIVTILLHIQFTSAAMFDTSPLIHQWVSEPILNGTSAQVGYTVPFTSVHAGKYRTEDKSTTDRHTTKTKHNPEKANNTKHRKTKLAWFSRLLRHSARKRGGLIVQCSWAHTGPTNVPRDICWLLTLTS